MAEGYLAGLLKGFYDYTADERKRVREAEDAELSRREALLKDAYDRAMSGESALSAQHYAQLLKDYMTVQGAASGPRKSKGGVSGFFGATELPMSRFLDAVLSGEIGFMEPAKMVGGLPTSFNRAVPSLNEAGAGAGSLLPPPPPAASPFAGLQMGPGAPPESRPRFSAGPSGPAAPFNSPRLTMAGAPPPPPPPVAPVAPVAPAGPQSFLRRNPVNQQIEANALARALSAENLEQTIAQAVAAGATPEEVQRLRLWALGVPQAPVRNPTRVGTMTRDGRAFAQMLDPVSGEVTEIEVDPDQSAVPFDFRAMAKRVTGKDVTRLEDLTQAELTAVMRAMEPTLESGAAAAAGWSSPVVVDIDGQQHFVSFNPRTGQTRIAPVGGIRMGSPLTEKQRMEVEQRKKAEVVGARRALEALKRVAPTAPGAMSVIGKPRVASTIYGAIGGTPAGNFATNFDTFTAIATIPELQNLRGLGHMSDREFAVMQQTAQALRTQLTVPEYTQIYNDLLKKYQAVITRAERGETVPDATYVGADFGDDEVVDVDLSRPPGADMLLRSTPRRGGGGE